MARSSEEELSGRSSRAQGHTGKPFRLWSHNTLSDNPPSFPPSSLPPSLSPSLCPYIYMISIIHITVPLEDRVPDGHNVLPGAAKHLQGTRLPSDRLFGAAHGIRSTIWCEAFETNGALERSALQARRVAGVGVVASFPASSSGPRSCCRSWCTAGGVHTCVCIIP